MLQVHLAKAHSASLNSKRKTDSELLELLVLLLRNHKALGRLELELLAHLLPLPLVLPPLLVDLLLMLLALRLLQHQELMHLVL